MKILVLGSNGMAGHVVTQYLKKQNYQVSTAARSNADHIFDASDTKSVNDLLNNIDVDYIINCVGLLVQESNTRPDNAIKINSWFPQYLAYKLQNSYTRLIHFSTDCVFDGSNGPYNEQSHHTELNYYGKSKSLGEVNNGKDITFRMSIIGPELKNGVGLFNFIYNNSKIDLPGWENAWWNGITTLQLAQCIEKYMSNPSVVGIYHLVNNEVSINKFDLLCLINKIFNLQKNIVKSQGPKTINKILIDTRQQFNFQIPDYETQLLELKEFMINLHPSSGPLY